MTTATRLAPEQLADRVAPQPVGPGPIMDALRQQSTRPAEVVVDPMAVPGGLAAEGDGQDPWRARRQLLKVLLAGGKLHMGLVTAALSLPGDSPNNGRAPEEAEIAVRVTRYVERATVWIEATTRELEQRWREGAAAPEGEALALSDYHRYEIARGLVSTLRQRPEWLEQVEPAHMAAWLTAPSPRWSTAPPATDWVSAGAAMDRRMAWSRTLARVLETAVDHPFNRELNEVLEDARVALVEAVEHQTQALTGRLELTPEARRVVELHTLKIAGQLYAATLRQVYQESTRMIQRYQDLLGQGQEDEADRLAQAYQERRLGYAGIPHYFQQIAALHERQQDDALTTALSKTAALTDSPLLSEPTAPLGRTVRAPGPGQG
jgi:hypothetical protein